MKDKMNKNVFYVLPVLAILAVIAIGLLFVQPKYNEIVDLNAKKQEELDKQEKMTTKLRTLSQLESQKTDLQARLQNLAIAVPNQKEIPGLIIALQKIAQASDVELQAIQLTPGVLLNDPSVTNKTAPELPIVINFKGNYDAIKTFLGRVYKAKRLLNMSVLALNTSAAAGEEGQITANLNMTAYFQPLPGKPKDITEAVPTETVDDKAVYDALDGYTAYTIDSTEGSTPKATPVVTEKPTSTSSATTQ